MTNYAFIGDIHSQSGPLSRALAHCHQNNLTPIFLGDLFDTRCEFSDSVGVMTQVRRAQADLGAIVLRSNHQNKLERFLMGNKVKVGPDLARTIQDFNDAGVPLNDVFDWLNTFPYGFCFRDRLGVEYRAAHALFPGSLEVPEYETTYSVMEVSRKDRDLMIYGPFRGSKGGQLPGRVAWWEETHRPIPWTRVAGHYHEVFFGPHALVLDGGMGGSSVENIPLDQQSLVLYDVNLRLPYSFGHES